MIRVRQILLLAAGLLLSSITFAEESQQVENWTADTLTQTLTVNYQETEKDFYPIRRHYSFDAWGMIVNFLGDLMQDVRTQKLYTHPEALTSAKVTDAGVYSGIRYWRVEQDYALPRAGIMIHFSVIVIAGNPDSDTPYVIQSLSMTRRTMNATQ